MTIKKNVLVTWTGEKANNLPNIKRYITVAKFEEDKTSWENEAWSIVLEFENSPNQQGNPSKASAKFLMEDAPVERLKKINSIFELYEGRTKTAEVKIIE